MRETSVHVSGSFRFGFLVSMKSTYISRSRPLNCASWTLMEQPSSVCIHNCPTDSIGFAMGFSGSGDCRRILMPSSHGPSATTCVLLMSAPRHSSLACKMSRIQPVSRSVSGLGVIPRVPRSWLFREWPCAVGSVPTSTSLEKQIERRLVGPPTRTRGSLRSSAVLEEKRLLQEGLQVTERSRPQARGARWRALPHQQRAQPR
jgi:hypothetical protein